LNPEHVARGTSSRHLTGGVETDRDLAVVASQGGHRAHVQDRVKEDDVRSPASALLDVAEKEAASVAALLPRVADLLENIMPAEEAEDLLQVSKATTAMLLVPALAGGVLASSVALGTQHGPGSKEGNALAQFPLKLPTVPPGSNEDDPFEQIITAYQVSLVSTVISGLVYSLLIGIVATFYYHEKVFPPVQTVQPFEHYVPDGDWRFGLLSCCDEPAMSCLACFCAPIRWADTMFMAGFMQFHVAVLVFVGLVFVNSCLAGVGSIVLFGMLVYYRQKLRGQFLMPRGSCGSIFCDCCTYCWCMCCAIVQEARQVEEAYQAKHPAVTHLVP